MQPFSIALFTTTLAVCQVAPVAAITHIAEVEAVPPYNDTGKCMCPMSARSASRILAIKRLKSLKSRANPQEHLPQCLTAETLPGRSHQDASSSGGNSTDKSRAPCRMRTTVTALADASKKIT